MAIAMSTANPTAIPIPKNHVVKYAKNGLTGCQSAKPNRSRIPDLRAPKQGDSRGLNDPAQPLSEESPLLASGLWRRHLSRRVARFSRDRTISSGSLLPIVSVMQATDVLE
jgi:hypothetical protein